MANFKKAQQIVGLNEGGYQNDPRDSGNYHNGKLIGTNWGISAPVLAEFLGRSPNVLEMRNLKRQTAELILKLRFWLKNELDSLKNQSLATLIYDGVVNHGTNGMRFLMNKAIKSLGGSVNYYEIFTKKGIKYLNSLNQRRLFNAVKAARTVKYKSSKQTHYIQSWLNRLTKIQYYANNTLSAIWPAAAVFIGIIGIFLIAL